MRVEPPYVHDMVNHEEEIVNKYGHHTNNIEATWSVLKKAMPARYRNKRLLQGFLYELMWCSKHKGCLWDALLMAL